MELWNGTKEFQNGTGIYKDGKLHCETGPALDFLFAGKPVLDWYLNLLMDLYKDL